MLAPLKALMHRSEPLQDEAKRAREEKLAIEAEKVIAAQFATLDAALSPGPYFCGAFSIADIAVFMSVHFTQRLGGPALAPTARLAKWYKLAKSRPAFERAAREMADADRALSAPVAGAFKDGL
jgi:glutathione S-transferase